MRAFFMALLLSVAALAVPSSALAGGEQKPGCDYKFASHKCDTDGDKIVVVNEPAGENCPAGGVKIILFKDDHDYDWSKHDRFHKVFFVCNGKDGMNGTNGENGTGVQVAPEPVGANCAAGGIKVIPVDKNGGLGDPFFVCNGVAGPVGPQGAQGPPGLTGPRGPRGSTPQLPRSCRSTRIAHWQIVIANAHRIRSLRTSFEGVRAPRHRNVFKGRRGWDIRVNMRGLPHGIYVARIRYRVSVNGGAFRRNTKVHYFRACYGNPKGGGIAGPNRFPVEVV